MEEEKLREESPQPAESGGAAVSPAAAARTAAKVAEPIAAAGQFRTSDSFFAALCRAKADGFAIATDKPAGEQPMSVTGRWASQLSSKQIG